MTKKKFTIGISSCLLGDNVRYDGKSKRANSLIKSLASEFILLPICPEVEIGMSVPRERIKLIGDIKNPYLIGEESGKDWSQSMREFSRLRVMMSDFGKISGLVLKSKSPSCGIGSAKLYQDADIVSEKGSGLFAMTVMQLCRNMPISDEINLEEPNQIDKFINSVIAYAKR